MSFLSMRYKILQLQLYRNVRFHNILMVYFIGTYQAGPECLHCEEGCSKSRPMGCPHPCVLPCHPGECPPCVQMLRRQKCHCQDHKSLCGMQVSRLKRNTLVLPAILTVIFFYNSEPLIQYFKEYFSVQSLEAGGLYFSGRDLGRKKCRGCFTLPDTLPRF